jgi:biotin carboxyl carrier protein
MYEVKLKNEVLQVEKNKGAVKVNGQYVLMDIVKSGQKTFHVLIDNTSMTLELVSWDPLSRLISLIINGKAVDAQVSNEQDLLLEKLGIAQSKVHLASEIKAPMPGLILDVLINEGDNIQKGDVLLVLEAMKMENSIKASSAGVVKTVLVEIGQSVEKNQVMIQF